MVNNPVTKHTDPAKNYFPALDGLRFLAFVLVFCHHQQLFSGIPVLNVLYTHGWIGVDLFFALSAYLLTHLLTIEFRQTSNIDIRKFYIRRILRIWPLYFVFVLFSVAVYAFYQGGFSGNVLVRIVGLFTLSDNIFAASFGYNPLPFAGHLWTIAYEEQFYVFIPLVVLRLMRSHARPGIALFVFIFILFNGIRLWFIAAQVQHPAIWVLPVTHFESILMGVALGTGALDVWIRRIPPIVALLVSLVFFGIICQLPQTNEISYNLIITYTCIGFSTSFLLCAVLNSKILSHVFSTSALVFLGKRSYALYILHLLGSGVATFITAQMPQLPAGTLPFFLYSISFTIIASMLSYRFLELPFLKWKRQFEVISSRPV